MNPKQIAENILKTQAKGASIAYLNECSVVAVLAKAHLEALEVLANVSKIIDGIKTELNASVYTVADDEFEKTYFCRDMINMFLKLHDDKETGDGGSCKNYLIYVSDGAEKLPKEGDCLYLDSFIGDCNQTKWAVLTEAERFHVLFNVISVLQQSIFSLQAGVAELKGDKGE